MLASDDIHLDRCFSTDSLWSTRYFNVLSNVGRVKSSVDDLTMERGTVSMRVAFVLRSAEVQPLFRDLCGISCDLSFTENHAECVAMISPPPKLLLHTQFTTSCVFDAKRINQSTCAFLYLLSIFSPLRNHEVQFVSTCNNRHGLLWSFGPSKSGFFSKPGPIVRALLLNCSSTTVDSSVPVLSAL